MLLAINTHYPSRQKYPFNTQYPYNQYLLPYTHQGKNYEKNCIPHSRKEKKSERRDEKTFVRIKEANCDISALKKMSRKTRRRVPRRTPFAMMGNKAGQGDTPVVNGWALSRDRDKKGHRHLYVCRGSKSKRAQNADKVNVWPINRPTDRPTDAIGTKRLECFSNCYFKL